MEFNNTLNKRRSVRKYTDQRIDDDLIDEIVKSGLTSPSAHHRQPWNILILRKEKDKISCLIEEYLELKKDGVDSSLPFTKEVIRRANACLLIYRNTLEKETRDHDLLSLGGMIENMLLKATDLEIGSLWIANITVIQEPINFLFSIEGMELVSGVLLGYAETEPKELKRKSLEEVVSYRER